MYTVALFKNRDSEPVIKHADNFGRLLDEKDLFFYGRILTNSERRYSNTSPWMNRMGLGTEYIIIPKYFEHDGDMRLAVSDKFAIVKKGESDLTVMLESDISKISTAIEDACTPEAVAEKKQEMAEAKYRGMLFQTYRAIYALEKDEHTQKLRNALIEDLPDCEHWADKIEETLKTAQAHHKNEEEMYFFMFLLNTHYRAAILSADIPNGIQDIYAPFYSLKAALRDPVRKEMLIKALDAESLRIYREFITGFSNI